MLPEIYENFTMQFFLAGPQGANVLGGFEGLKVLPPHGAWVIESSANEFSKRKLSLNRTQGNIKIQALHQPTMMKGLQNLLDHENMNDDIMIIVLPL